MSSPGNLLIDQSQWSTDRLMNKNVCLAVSSQQNLIFKAFLLTGIQKLSTFWASIHLWWGHDRGSQWKSAPLSGGHQLLTSAPPQVIFSAHVEPCDGPDHETHPDPWRRSTVFAPSKPSNGVALWVETNVSQVICIFISAAYLRLHQFSQKMKTHHDWNSLQMSDFHPFACFNYCLNASTTATTTALHLCVKGAVWQFLEVLFSLQEQTQSERKSTQEKPSSWNVVGNSAHFEKKYIRLQHFRL